MCKALAMYIYFFFFFTSLFQNNYRLTRSCNIGTKKSLAPITDTPPSDNILYNNIGL